MLLYEILYVSVVCFPLRWSFSFILRNLVCERGLFPSLVVVLTIFNEILCERGLFPSLVVVLMLFYEILYVSVVCFPLRWSFSCYFTKSCM